MSLRKWILIGVLVCGIAGVNFALNPHVAPWSDDVLGDNVVSAAELSQALDEWLMLDARSEGDFIQDHIPGALLLNEDDWEALLPEVFDAWAPGQRVVVYCGSEACQASEQVAVRLREEVGFDDVMVLKGGWDAWLELGD